MPQIAVIGHIQSNLLELIHTERLLRELEPLDIIPIESPSIESPSKKIANSLLYGVLERDWFDIVSEVDEFNDYIPEPKKGIGQKAQWATKPHKRKRK